jgi:hypothetical protein
MELKGSVEYNPCKDLQFGIMYVNSELLLAQRLCCGCNRSSGFFSCSASYHNRTGATAVAIAVAPFKFMAALPAPMILVSTATPITRAA